MIYFIKKTALNRDKNINNSQFLLQFKQVAKDEEDPYRLTSELGGGKSRDSS